MYFGFIYVNRTVKLLKGTYLFWHPRTIFFLGGFLVEFCASISIKEEFFTFWWIKNGDFEISHGTSLKLFWNFLAWNDIEAKLPHQNLKEDMLCNHFIYKWTQGIIENYHHNFLFWTLSICYLSFLSFVQMICLS